MAKYLIAIFLSTALPSLGENLNLIDNFTQRSFNNIFAKSKNKEVIKKVDKIVFKINSLVNYKKYLTVKAEVILDDRCPNAFAIGDGYIFVCEDLALQLNNCELTYVIAHEISHIYNEDYKNSFNRLSNTSHNTIEDEIEFNLNTKNKYSRMQEIIADRDAVVWSSLVGCKEEDLLNAASTIFHDGEIKNSTHPNKKYRIQTINNMIRKLNYVKKNNLKDAERLLKIDKYFLALDKIDEYILYNFNEVKGYELRLKTNKLLEDNGFILSKNQIYQDCDFIFRYFGVKKKSCN